MEAKIIRPFLRWAGGKQYLVNFLIKFTPTNYKEGTYFEPFFGAGSLFFALGPQKAVLSDLNSHLIDCYKTTRDYPDTLYHYLLNHKKNNSTEYYYKEREKFNKYLDKRSIAQASRFIYLNRTCYNGIFRVNADGCYNVPFAPKKRLVFPSLAELHQFSKLFKNAEIFACSYEEILPKVKRDDFVYLDPPYPPLNGTSYFTHYTKDRFSITDQSNVHDFAENLSKKGCKVLISNADTPDTKKLYQHWRIFTVDVTRFISCKSKRDKVNELIITNYEL